MTQTITKIKVLAMQQKQQIKQLQANSFSTSGYQFKIDPSVLNDSPTNNASHFLLTDNGQIIAYMVTTFYNQTELEIAIIDASPSAYKQFMHLAKNEAIENGLSNLLLAVDRNDQKMVKNAIASNLSYSFSEYRLVYKDTVLTNSQTNNLTLRSAEKADLALINELDFQGFDELGNTQEADLSLIKLALINNQVIGKIRLEKTADSLGIFGFVVNRNYRNQGYGQEILAQVIEESIQTGCSYIYLEVAATNPSALNLYQRCGFKQEVSFDYYEHNLKKKLTNDN